MSCAHTHKYDHTSHAPQVAAIGTMLIFMKTAKVMRGSERMVKQLGSEVAVGLYTACTHTALPTL